jgi:hypothetical protein
VLVNQPYAAQPTLARISRSSAQEDEKSVAQKADAAEREHQTHEKLIARVNRSWTKYALFVDMTHWHCTNPTRHWMVSLCHTSHLDWICV